MTNTKVLVTGAGGFLGLYIVRDLLARGGYDIYSFSRSFYPKLESLGVKQYQGNISNLEDVMAAMRGVDAVIHTASLVGMWGRYENFYETNVLGTENIIQACRNLKISRLIYTSTPSVVFGNQSLCNVDESIAYPKRYFSMYAETKAIAEKLVLKANNGILSTTAIRPHLIFGPGDLNLVPRVIEAAKSNKLKIVGDGENLVDVSYVENASMVHVMALEKLSPGSAMAGKAYFYGQGPIKLWDFTNQILKRSGMKPVTKKIPFQTAYYIGWVFEIIFTIFRRFKTDPPMTRFVAMQLGKSHYYAHNNLERDLGFKPKFSIEEGLDLLFKK